MRINFVLKSRCVLEPFSSYRCLKSGPSKERLRKMALSLPQTFAFSCLPRSFWALIIMSLADHIKALKDECWTLLVYLWWSCMSFSIICIYCASVPSLHRESTDSLILMPRRTHGRNVQKASRNKVTQVPTKINAVNRASPFITRVGREPLLSTTGFNWLPESHTQLDSIRQQMLRHQQM